ncbi:urea transporter [Singulisphaera acidiphila]|uniref:Urea transporter n=1 Tax=Singulisphaera acidiphila (strain ATCC BAA-1392 / DSM 18658 / VKM B-2454 / MOB10) TaxID=886293 RepID=L0D8M0_SINAD|nr:urea transporter [Singulisphaera acidiphila]AGA25582.1 urea transporter [Singulisphaera acidiphila DSM 18658]
MQIVLRGVAQVMFQPHAGTGLLFVAGLAVGSPLVALGAFLGSAIGTGVAFLLKFDRTELRDGIYGFNSALVGLALLVLLHPVPATWALLVLGSALAAIVTHLARRFVPFPTYTAPFVLVTWLALALVHGVAGKSIDTSPPAAPRTPAGFVEAVLAGEAEVMLGSSAVTGILFLAGIALSDWRHATLALIGSVVGTLQSIYHHDPSGSISLGLYGYNASLAAMAIWLSRSSLALSILAAVVSVPLTEFFPKALGIPALTAPFVVASWIVLALLALDPLLGRTMNKASNVQRADQPKAEVT